ncbi:hypothetical protein ES319_A08G183500v1 [Gossypium barbadense]|uniref:Uncharacterized protein n=2 Tax=Gossypium TaxID=3633 RepID=A0A5J5UUF8_GOSBA|nr:hypothetical protein ES319_A08G183500v1 [Gossypium barbadense]TYH07061.1 hypothetical protein ES288_A08G202700v1 [Gossypium darwinii]
MGNDQILPSKAPLEEICISEILGISLAWFRGLIYNKSPFQLRSQRSEQRSKADSQGSTEAELYGEKAMEAVHGNPILLLLSYNPETSSLGSIGLPQIAKKKGYYCGIDQLVLDWTFSGLFSISTLGSKILQMDLD